MLRFLRRVLGKQRTTLPLGLADPSHPAKRWIDVATVIADRRLEVKVVDGKPAIETNSFALRDLVATLDLALGEAPEDADLLAVRAAARYLLDEVPEATRDIDRALRCDSTHVEASALRKYGQGWNNMLFLPSWSSESRYVHPFLAEKANLGDILHCVRHCLQPAMVLLLMATKEEYPNAPVRYRWDVVCSETPFGPIGAHYILLDLNGQVRRQEYILAPSTEAGQPNSPPPPLLGRLPCVRTCFIVLVAPTGEVLYNLRYDLPPALRSVLKKLTRRLSKASGTNSSDVRRAADWHMQHFDMDALTL